MDGEQRTFMNASIVECVRAHVRGLFFCREWLNIIVLLKQRDKLVWHFLGVSHGSICQKSSLGCISMRELPTWAPPAEHTKEKGNSCWLSREKRNGGFTLYHGEAFKAMLIHYYEAQSKLYSLSITLWNTVSMAFDGLASAFVVGPGKGGCFDQV